MFEDGVNCRTGSLDRFYGFIYKTMKGRRGLLGNAKPVCAEKSWRRARAKAKAMEVGELCNGRHAVVRTKTGDTEWIASMRRRRRRKAFDGMIWTRAANQKRQ